MATKNVKKAPAFTTINKGMVAISTLHVAFSYNESRKGLSSLSELIGLTKAKNPVMGKEGQDILDSMLRRGFDSTERVVITDFGIDDKSRKKDLANAVEERKAQREQIATLPVWKGEKGTFSYKEQDVELTHEDLIKEFELTYGSKDTMDGMKAIMSGNRRITMLLVRNAIVRKAGFEDDVVTEVECEERSYRTERDRKDDSVYLNERGKEGKLESTKLQKLGVGFEKLASGGIQQDFKELFPGNRGAQQIAYEIPACVRVVSWASKVTYGGEELTGKDAAERIQKELLDGTIPMPNQGKLARLRGFRMQCEHSDGHTKEFQTATKGRKANAYNSDTHLGRGNIAAFKKHLREHEEIAQGLATYFENIKDPKWVDPETQTTTPVSSMASTEIQAVAAQSDGLVETLLNVAAGAEKGHELADVAKALNEKLEEAHEPVFLRVKGELVGNPLTQDDVDKLCAALEKKRVNPSKAVG